MAETYTNGDDALAARWVEINRRFMDPKYNWLLDTDLTDTEKAMIRNEIKLGQRKENGARIGDWGDNKTKPVEPGSITVGGEAPGATAFIQARKIKALQQQYLQSLQSADYDGASEAAKQLKQMGGQLPGPAVSTAGMMPAPETSGAPGTADQDFGGGLLPPPNQTQHAQAPSVPYNQKGRGNMPGWSAMMSRVFGQGGLSGGTGGGLQGEVDAWNDFQGDKVNRALGLVDQTMGTAIDDINQNFRRGEAATNQGLINRGLGNSTIVDSVMSGMRRRRDEAITNARAGLTRMKVPIVMGQERLRPPVDQWLSSMRGLGSAQGYTNGQ